MYPANRSRLRLPSAMPRTNGWARAAAASSAFAHHSDRASYREDRRRWNALVEAGYTVLRFTFEDVVRNEERVAALIASVLQRHSQSQVRER